MSDFTESQNIMNKLFQPFSSAFVDFEEISEGNTTFGKIKLNINEFPITKKHLNLEFNIDNSGSMSDVCADGRTKMDHMNFTVENILRYLQEHDVSAVVSVNSFDDTIRKIIHHEKLESKNMEEFASKICKIRPNGGTDIARVLEMAAIFKQPDNYLGERIFLMFTDGQANLGSTTDKKELKKIADKISEKTTIVTVGCGLDHDYELLSSIADRKNSSYKFIGKLEEAALACGEILDKILSKILKNVTITIENGEIYNWKTNEWTNRIETENIVAECDKTYNIRSSTPYELSVTITAIIVETDEPFEFSIIDKNMNQDLRKDKFRQRTLELLYEVNFYNKNTKEHTPEKNKEFKNKLKDFLKEMKKFMDDSSLRGDLFMKMLCDDIFVSHSTFGTAYGNMYVASRQTSQGTQGIHNNTVPEEFDNFQLPPSRFSFSKIPLTRSVTHQIQTMEEDDEEAINTSNYQQFCSIPAPPKLKRTFTRNLNFVNEYKYYVEEDENEDLLSNHKTMEEDDENDDEAINTSNYQQFCSIPALPKVKIPFSRNVNFIDEELEDILANHKTMESDESPYVNNKTLTLMREVSRLP